MNRGFQIEIQKDLNEEELSIATAYIHHWISKTCETNLTYLLGGKSGGWGSYLRRGRFGFLLPYSNKSLIFRRISTNRRVFGVFRTNTVVKPDGDEIKLGCMCGKCTGEERVVWRDDKPETFVYAVVGDVKG
jgi:hypothetical protein